MKIRLLSHLFAHIHGDCGEIEEKVIIFSNTAVLDERYRLVNTPRLIELRI